MKIFFHRCLFPGFVMIIYSLIIGGCLSQPVFPRSSITHVPNVTEKSVQLIWSAKEVYVQQNDFQPMMSAYSGSVCILGDLVYPPQNGLSCLSSSDGTAAWQKSIRTPSGILMDSDGVYVSNGGTAGLTKFDYTGKLDWRVSLIETSVKYMYLYNNQIQLFLLPEKLMILEKDYGDEVAVLDGERIIYSTETERFVIDYSLESRSLDLKEENWHLDISSSNIRLAPIFTDNLIFVRTGRVMGTLLALDRTTGQIFWKTENTIISNIAYWPTERVLFALTKSGQLLKINIDSGVQSILFSFSPGSFVLNGDASVGGYELALDESNNILFILLGDSRELFAFKIE